MDARNSKLWGKYMKHEDNYVEWNKWKEWCDHQEEESKKNREALLTKDNTDNNSVYTMYATESTDSTSVTVIQCKMDNIKTIFSENEKTKYKYNRIGITWQWLFPCIFGPC